LTEQLSIELLEKTHVFPCPYMFKLIGNQDQGFVARVVAAVREGLQADRDPPYTTRATADGKHVAVSLEPVVYSPHQILAVYDRVRGLEGLRYLW
jgi:putative lipoic acid-binding regulatory protein